MRATASTATASTATIASRRNTDRGLSTRAPFGAESGDAAHAGDTARQVRLTPRELEVLSLLSEGLPNKLISRRLNIAASTVKVHMGNILRKTGVSSRLQAVVSAWQYGLVGASASLQGTAGGPFTSNREGRSDGDLDS